MMKFKRWKKMIVMLMVATMFLQSVVVYADDGTSTMPSQTITSDAQAAANDEPTTSQTPSDGSGNAEDPDDQDGKDDADNPADPRGKGNADDPDNSNRKVDGEGSKEVTKPVDGEVDDNDVDADEETDEEVQETEPVNEEVPEEVKAFLEAVAKLPDSITTAEEYDTVEAAMVNLLSQYDALSDEAKNGDSVKGAKAKLDKLQEQLKDGRPEAEEELSAAVKAFLDAVDAIEVPEEDLMLEENAELAEEFGEKIWTASDLFDALTEEEQELEEVQIAYMELNNFATVITGDIQTMALSNVVVAPNYNPGSCISGVSKFGGSISKTVGESGFYKRRAIHDFHCPTCGWFFGRSDAKEYANFEVIQTNPSVISDISYEVGNLQGYPCLQMNFIGAQAGTTKVTLRYDVNFHTRWNSGYAACPSCGTMTSVDQYDDNWYHYEDTFYVTVTDSQSSQDNVHWLYIPANYIENGSMTYEATNIRWTNVNDWSWYPLNKPQIIDAETNTALGNYVNISIANKANNGGYGYDMTISGLHPTPDGAPAIVKYKYYGQNGYGNDWTTHTLKIVVYEPETITLKKGQTETFSCKSDVSGRSYSNFDTMNVSASNSSIKVQNNGGKKYKVTGNAVGNALSSANYAYLYFTADYGKAFVNTQYLDVVKFNIVPTDTTTTPVTIVKEFDGLTEDQIPENFSLEYTINGCSTCGTKNGSLKYADATVTNANGTPSLVWNVDLPVAKHGTVAHTITFSESGAEVQGFKNPTLIGKTVTLESLTAEDGATKPVITVTNKYESDNTMYVLSYDGMGGTGCPATQYTKIGNSTSHTFNVRGADSENPIKIPTHPQGYKFLGWAETDTNQELKYIYNSEDATYSPAAITLTNANPSKTLYAVWEQRPHTVKPKLTGLDKVRVTDENEVNGAPDDVEYGPVIFRSDDGKVKLLYKITVSGTEGAKYKVTDEGAEHVSGGTAHNTEKIDGKDTLVVTGTLDSTGKAYIYVTKEFSAASGTLTNTAKLASNDSDTEGPGTGDGKDEKTDGGTDASEKRNVKVEFKIDPTDEDAENVEEGKLKDTFDKDYDKNGDFTYPGIEGKPSTVRKALQRTAQATTETLVIPWKITKTINGKEITFVLDETASKTALEMLSSLTTITENVTAELIYARDMKGNGTDNNGNFVDTTDGIPDKYQAKIIYDANGKGTIDNKPNKQEYVTIYSNNDQTAMTTSGSVTITGATVVANSGQYCTGWTASATDTEWSHSEVSGSTVNPESIQVKGNKEYTFTAQYISAPTREEIPGILDPNNSKDFKFVIVDCVNATITPSHEDEQYGLVSEKPLDVTVGSVTADNGEYTCDVTVSAVPYVAEYVKINGDHALVDSTKDAATLTLKWNGTKWESAVSGKNTVTFKVRCGSPSANVNITRNYKYTLDGVVTEQTAGPNKIAVEIKEGKLTITTGNYAAYDGKTYEFKSAVVKKQDGTESSFTDSMFEFDADTDKTYDVILNYELAEASVKTVTIKYVDDEGNELKSELKLKGDKDPFKYGDTYDPSAWVNEGGTIDVGDNHYIIEKVEDSGNGEVKDNVTITVTCTRDNLVDPTVTKDPDDPDKGDGIPDKYQAEVTFAAVNGTLTGTTSVVVTLKDGDGNPAENGTATLTAGQIPTATANDGYGNGTWTPGTPVEGYEITGKTDFVITFTANTPTPTPTPGGGDDPTPTPPGGGGGGTPDPTPTPPVPELTPLIPEIVPAVGPTTTVVPNVTPVAATPAVPTPKAALVSPTPEAVELADEAVPLAAEEEKQPELETVDEEKTPLAGGRGAAWALINFALMNLAIFESVMLLIGYFVKTKNDEEEEKRKLKKKGIFRVISLPIAIISLIVFILTEDITLPTAFVDKYTIVMLIIAIVQTVMVALSKKQYEDEDEQGV